MNLHFVSPFPPRETKVCVRHRRDKGRWELRARTTNISIFDSLKSHFQLCVAAQPFFGRANEFHHYFLGVFLRKLGWLDGWPSPPCRANTVHGSFIKGGHPSLPHSTAQHPQPPKKIPKNMTCCDHRWITPSSSSTAYLRKKYVKKQRSFLFFIACMHNCPHPCNHHCISLLVCASQSPNSLRQRERTTKTFFPLSLPRG